MGGAVCASSDSSRPNEATQTGLAQAREQRTSLPPFRRSQCAQLLLPLFPLLLLLFLSPSVSSLHTTSASGRSDGAGGVSMGRKQVLEPPSMLGLFLLESCRNSINQSRPTPPLHSDHPPSPRRQYPIGPLSPSAYHSDLGWAEAWGEALDEARVNEQACFHVMFLAKDGTPFDKECLQRASLFARLTSDAAASNVLLNTQPGIIRLAADISYLPHASTHRVCYTIPNPGVYHLEVALIFTNAFLVQTARRPVHTAGFAGYAPVLTSAVRATSSKQGYALYWYRQGLPECSLRQLAESRNDGYWVAHTWVPRGCRLRRLSPLGMLKWLNGKNVLFLGDSEMRYVYGFLQVYLSLPSRGAFWHFWKQHPFSKASVLERAGVPRDGVGDTPPRDPNTGGVWTTTYTLPTGDSAFFGSRYSGFGRQHLSFDVASSGGDDVHIDANLTYVSFFNASKKVFEEWMLDGSSVHGMTPVGSGRPSRHPGAADSANPPFDLVMEASLLHGVLHFESMLDFSSSLTTSLIPQLRALCPRKEGVGCVLASFGPLAGVEEDKGRFCIHKSNNVRNAAFETAWYSTMRGQGLENMLPMDAMTRAVRKSELTADPAHYLAPVSLAMLDLVLGPLCGAKCGGPLV